VEPSHLLKHTQEFQTLILASASPRRRDLLGQLGLTFAVEAAELDETPLPAEPADMYVQRLAREKACSIAGRHLRAWVLAADTTVVLEGEILGKPRDEAEARAMLARLSGHTHEVLTAVALDGVCRDELLASTRVTFRTLSAQEISWYVETGEPLDKAGAYALQGRAGAFVRSLEGSPTNVIGLPLPETVELLERAGLTLPWRR
jgi:septum formation protein